MQPLLEARKSLLEPPAWACDKATADLPKQATLIGAATDTISVAKLAHISANVMERFSFGALCRSVESMYEVRPKKGRAPLPIVCFKWFMSYDQPP